MKCKHKWIQSKFILMNGKLKVSKNIIYLSISSRILANSIANFYNTNIPMFVRGRLVDLGCGKVPFYGFYKEYITENICIDWNNTRIENPFLDQTQDLNQKLQLEDSSFDTILLSDVLEHIRKPEFLMEEMHRILKPNGTVILNVPFFYWIHEEPYDYYRYTEYALKSMAEDAGFTIIKVETLGGLPEVLGDLFAKTLVSIPIIGKQLAKFVQYGIIAYIKTKKGKKLSQSTAKKFPLGYGMILKK